MTTLLLAAVLLAGCEDPTAQQALIDTRTVPVRGDTMLAVGFGSGTSRLDAGQDNALRGMILNARHAQRDEFIVVTDGTGGTLQNLRAQQVRSSLLQSGARWVSTSVEPAMAMGPNQVVVVRSEYRIGERNCPDFSTTETANPNSAIRPNYGCSDAYNMGQMLARPRDAAIGREPGPSDGQVLADAIQRYREGRVRIVGAATTGGSGGSAGVVSSQTQ
jgi:type IV pilus biogenesis protein CpaD/CtpE